MPKSCKPKTKTKAKATLGKFGAKQGSKTKSESTRTISDESAKQSNGLDEFNIEVISRDNDEPYGLGSCAPEWLQFLRRSPVWFLVVMCLMMVAQSFIQFGVVVGSLSTWQRRFQFNAIDLAVIRSMYEMGGCLILLPVMYFGDQNIRRPLWGSIGSFTIGLGAVILTTAHFLLDRHTHIGGREINLCRNETTNSTQSCENFNNNNFKFIFMLGELLIGMGYSVSYVMGITYLDENVSARLSSVYTAIQEMCVMIGAVLGFLTTAQVLTIPGDIDKGGVQSTNSHRDDWYGAWWIGALIGAALAWISSALMLPFPTQLSGAIVARIRDAQEAALVHHDQSYETDTKEKGIKQWWKKVKNLMCNFVFVGTAVEECCRSFLVGGFVFFSATYLETMFDADKSFASNIVGGLLSSATLVGVIYGSVVQYVLHLEVLGNLRLCVASAFSTIVFSLVFLVKCTPTKFEGHYDPNGVFQLNLPCNQHCYQSCTTDYFDPICFLPQGRPKEKVMYFSPCFAGCDEKPSSDNFTSCFCLEGHGTVKEGRCKCSEYLLYAFLVGLCWVAMSIFVRTNPVFQLILRAVHFNQRVIAVSFALAITKLARMWGVFVFGKILYDGCQKFITLCGRDQMCAVYKKEKIVTAFMASFFVFSIVCLFALLVALCSHMKRLNQLGAKSYKKMIPPAYTRFMPRFMKDLLSGPSGSSTAMSANLE